MDRAKLRTIYAETPAASPATPAAMRSPTSAGAGAGASQSAVNSVAQKALVDEDGFTMVVSPRSRKRQLLSAAASGAGADNANVGEKKAPTQTPHRRGTGRRRRPTDRHNANRWQIKQTVAVEQPKLSPQQHAQAFAWIKQLNDPNIKGGNQTTLKAIMTDLANLLEPVQPNLNYAQLIADARAAGDRNKTTRGLFDRIMAGVEDPTSP